MPKSTRRTAWVYYSREDKLGRRYTHNRKFTGKDQVSANIKARAFIKKLRKNKKRYFNIIFQPAFGTRKRRV